MQGGYLMGNSHANGGIKIKTPEGQIEAEGGEVIVNKRVLSLNDKFVCEGNPKEITSKINEMEGGVSWSDTGSCRLVSRAEDGSEIEANRSDDGYGVLYVSGGKTYIVTADTEDQAEIIRDSIKDYKDGLIEKSELENTLQSYMNDEEELADDIYTISGKPHVYNGFYAGYIPLMDSEAINIDESSAIEFKDGGGIYNNVIQAAKGFNIDKTDPTYVKNQILSMNFEYEEVRNDFKLGHINENEYYDYKKDIVNKYLPYIEEGKKLGIPVNAGLIYNTNVKVSNGASLNVDNTAANGTILRSSNPEKRPSPSVSATIYPAGYQMEGNDGNIWEIALDSRGIHRWKKLKGEDGLDIAEDGMELNKPFSAKEYAAHRAKINKEYKEKREKLGVVLYCEDANGVPDEYELNTLLEDEDYRIDVDKMNASYSYEFYKGDNLVCVAQIDTINYEYKQGDEAELPDNYYRRRGLSRSRSFYESLFYPTDYNLNTDECDISDEDTALLEKHARIIFNKFLKDVDISESLTFIITREELQAELKSGIELAANGKKVTKESLLNTVSTKKDEYWFTPEGRITSEKKGTANEFIQHEWAKMFGANNMKLVGGDEKEYVYELEGNPMMIAAATSYLQEEKGVEIETYGHKKRVHIPKKVIDSTSAHLRYPLITPFANGGGVEKKIESLEKQKKKLIEEYNVAIEPEKEKIYQKIKDIRVDIDYAKREMYVAQEKEDSNKMTIDFMKALEEGGIMTPGTHKNKADVDSIKSIISMDGYEFSKYIKKVKDRKIDGIYREFQDWKQTYKMANGGGVGNKIAHIHKNKAFSSMPLQFILEDWTDGQEGFLKSADHNPNYLIKWAEDNGYEVINKDEFIKANGGGVDLPENYYQHAIERENKIYTGDNYVGIISQYSPNFFHKDVSFMGYVDKFGEFYDVPVGDDAYRYANGGGVPQAKYGRSFGSYKPYKKSYRTGFSGRTNRGEYLGNGVWGDDEGNRWDKDGKTVSGYGLSGEKSTDEMSDEEYKEKYGRKTVAPVTEDARITKANLIASRIAAKKGQPVTEKLVQWVLKQMDEGKFAADGKQIEQADILTNSMLSILDLYNYISSKGNKIIIQGSPYTYASHGKYNLRVLGGKGATYNIVPYFPERRGMFEDANFYSLIRQKRHEHFAITKNGELIDVAEDGTEIKS